jgi:hypothetical protein
MLNFVFVFFLIGIAHLNAVDSLLGGEKKKKALLLCCLQALVFIIFPPWGVLEATWLCLCITL